MTDTFRAPDEATELGAAMALAMTACDEADALALASFRKALEVEEKPDNSFVTQADRAIERAIRTRIVERFPDHGLVGEEYGEGHRERAADSGRRWIIDPIDGTHNYMRGVPIFATLLALEVDGGLVLGAVSAPALARRWFSWQGHGAWVVALVPGGWDMDSVTRISVSGIDDLASASVMYSSVPSITRSGLAPGFLGLLDEVWRDRGLGDFYGYMLVAEGAAEAMLEAELKTWDLAGPRAVLLEAGGMTTDLLGGKRMPASGVLATNGHLHDTLLARLAQR